MVWIFAHAYGDMERLEVGDVMADLTYEMGGAGNLNFNKVIGGLWVIDQRGLAAAQLGG